MKIGLFFPSVGVGGIEYQFARLANHLANRGHHVTYIDTSDINFTNLNLNKVKTIIAIESKPITVDCDILIITTGSIFDTSRWIEKNNNTRILAWSLHPLGSCFIPPLKITKLFLTLKPEHYAKFIRCLSPINYIKRRAALSFLENKNSLYFMDDENLNYTNRFYNLRIEKKFLPVSIETNKTISTKQAASKKIRAYWMGRLVDFKVHILKKIIQDISHIAQHHDISLTIIGDGPEYKAIFDASKRLNIDITFKGELDNSQAQSEIKKNADLVFAMGTSAIESASNRRCTVLVDAGYGNIFTEYKYKWIFEAANYSLGRIITKESITDGYSIQEIINQIITNKDNISQRCESYAKENHSIEKLGFEIEKKANHLEAHLLELQRLESTPLLVKAKKFITKKK